MRQGSYPIGLGGLGSGSDGCEDKPLHLWLVLHRPRENYQRYHGSLDIRTEVIYIVHRIGKLNTMIKNYANNFFFEAEASAEAYFAYSVRC